MSVSYIIVNTSLGYAKSTYRKITLQVCPALRKSSMKLPNLIANFKGEMISAISGFAALPKGFTAGFKWIIILMH